MSMLKMIILILSSCCKTQVSALQLRLAQTGAEDFVQGSVVVGGVYLYLVGFAVVGGRT